MEKIYAKALIGRLEAGDSAASLMKSLKTHLEAKGRLRLLPRILRELKRAEQRREKHFPVLEVAHQSETAHALKECKALGYEVTGSRVVPELISGWRLLAGDVLIDRSSKRSLQDLYQNITKH